MQPRKPSGLKLEWRRQAGAQHAALRQTQVVATTGDFLMMLEATTLAGAGVAEVGAGAVALGLGGLGFLALVFGDFFFAVGVGIAGGEHRGGTAGLPLLFADFAELVANLAQRSVDGLDLDEQVADFFQKIVKVERADDIGQAGLFQRGNELAAHLGNEVKDADARAFVAGDAAQFTEGGEDRRVQAGHGYVGDDEGPLAGFELGEEEVSVGDDADAPAFGVEDLAEGALALRIVEDEDTNLASLDGNWSGAHLAEYSAEEKRKSDRILVPETYEAIGSLTAAPETGGGLSLTLR
jgi:hypothetical protein